MSAPELCVNCGFAWNDHLHWWLRGGEPVCPNTSPNRLDDFVPTFRAPVREDEPRSHTMWCGTNVTRGGPCTCAGSVVIGTLGGGVDRVACAPTADAPQCFTQTLPLATTEHLVNADAPPREDGYELLRQLAENPCSADGGRKRISARQGALLRRLLSEVAALREAAERWQYMRDALFIDGDVGYPNRLECAYAKVSYPATMATENIDEIVDYLRATPPKAET